jgi:hypothetical protein
MKNETLVQELETNYANFSTDSIEIIFHMPYGVVENTIHTGTWQDHDFTCECEISWSNGEFKTEYHNLDELIEILKEKDFAEISGNDFDDIELVHTHSGDVTVKEIKWDGKKPSKKKLEDLDKMDLYNNSEITDCEYKIEAGQIDKIEIKLRGGKDTLTLTNKGYEFDLGPRIKTWSDSDNKKFLRDYTKALITLKDLQERYNLLVEEGIENLPKIEDLPVTPEYNADAHVVYETRDFRDNKCIQLTLWSEHGSAFSFCFTDVVKLIDLRNQLAKQIDLFGRGYLEKKGIEKVWMPEMED